MTNLAVQRSFAYFSGRGFIAAVGLDVVGDIALSLRGMRIVLVPLHCLFVFFTNEVTLDAHVSGEHAVGVKVAVEVGVDVGVDVAGISFQQRR